MADTDQANLQTTDLTLLDGDVREKVAIAAINRMEQEYLAEYYMLAEKDKAAGKDFNKQAHDKMVRAQHDFDMLRKMERQSHEGRVAKAKQQSTLLVAAAQTDLDTETAFKQ